MLHNMYQNMLCNHKNVMYIYIYYNLYTPINITPDIRINQMLYNKGGLQHVECVM